MKRKAGTVCTALGIALLLAALSLFGYNEWQSAKAGQAASAALEEIAPLWATPETAESAMAPDAMPAVEVDGQTYVGMLNFPTLNLELPVMAGWDYDKLQSAPCRYSGSLATADLVIAGHNYTRHFGRLDTLQPGDEVIFTTMNGLQHHYAVALVETLAATDLADMTAGEYPLSLFTCNYSGQARVTVRCEASDDL